MSFVLCAFALLTKETAVMLPVVVFAHRWLFANCGESASQHVFSARLRSACIEATPYVGITVAYLLARVMVLGGGMHQTSEVGIWSTLLTLSSLLWFYTTHFAVPIGLSEFTTLSMSPLSHCRRSRCRCSP